MTQFQRFIVLGIGLFFGVLACWEYHWMVWVFEAWLGIAAVELLIMMARWRLGQPAKKKLPASALSSQPPRQITSHRQRLRYRRR